MAPTDAELVVRARRGDSEAYGALLRRHRPALDRVCERLLGDRVSAADVAQEAALVAWLQLDRLLEPPRFGAWLVGIGRVLSLRMLRERASARDRLTRDGALPEHATDPSDDPAERLLAVERTAELAAAISALPRGQRDAFVLFHLADLPQRLVAARLGTAPGAVGTRLHNARVALRARLRRAASTIEETTMPETAVPARVTDVRRTPAGRHIVLLAAEDRELPIWVGRPEAEALVAGLQNIAFPRPGTHALALSLLRANGGALAVIRIARLEAAVFYAELVLDDGTTVDARPSDALVIAAAGGVPLEVDRAVLDATSRSRPDEYDEDLMAARDNAQVLAAELREQMAAQADELEEVRRRYEEHHAGDDSAR